MDVNNCVCGVENCEAMAKHAIAAANACWGEVGFELPGNFNKVYLNEGPIFMDKKVEVCEAGIHTAEECECPEKEEPQAAE